MTEQAEQNYDDEINFLDILVTLAESWKLLVFGPLIAGLLAGVISFLLPKTFESQSVVRLTEVEMALLNSAPVLDSLVDKFGLLAEFDGVQEDARQALSKKIVGKLDKKTNLVTITTTSNTPERAQEMGKAVMDALLVELLPRGKSKDQIEQKINTNQRVILSNQDALDRLQRQMDKSSGGDAALDVVMKFYASLTAEVAAKELENIELRKSLSVKGDEVYVQRASLPQRKTSPKGSLVVLLAVCASASFLLMFVFIRKAWISIVQDNKSASKLAAIRRAFGFQRV